MNFIDNPCKLCGSRECVIQRCELKNVFKQLEQDCSRYRNTVDNMLEVQSTLAKSSIKLDRCLEEIKEYCKSIICKKYGIFDITITNNPIVNDILTIIDKYEFTEVSQRIGETDEEYKQRILATMKDKE